MKISTKLFMCLFMLMSSISLFAGPFGLEMGMRIEDIDSKAQKIKPGMYLITTVPKPHSSFGQYIVQVGPKTGLCWIKAIGKDINTSAYGNELRSAFIEMREKLAKSYGEGKTSDFLRSGSIWKDANDYMMALLKKERILACMWENPKDAKDIKSLALIASASDRETGHISIEYAFKNESDAEKEIASLEDSAL